MSGFIRNAVTGLVLSATLSFTQASDAVGQILHPDERAKADDVIAMIRQTPGLRELDIIKSNKSKSQDTVVTLAPGSHGLDTCIDNKPIRISFVPLYGVAEIEGKDRQALDKAAADGMKKAFDDLFYARAEAKKFNHPDQLLIPRTLTNLAGTLERYFGKFAAKFEKDTGAPISVFAIVQDGPSVAVCRAP